MENESNIKGGKSSVKSMLHEKIFFWQKKITDHLNFRCRNISSKGLLAILIAFVVLTSALLLRLIISAIQ